MANVKCRVCLDDQTFQIKVAPDCSVAALQIKVRKFLKIKPDLAIFLFFQYDGLFTTHECLHSGNRLMGDIRAENGMDVQIVRVCRESTFGAISKMFLRAKIEKKLSVFVLTCWFSWYGLSHYSEVTIHASAGDARAALLAIRCNGYLSEEEKKD